jgi:transcriptional regulator with XRE-family HTH domain
MGTKETRLQRGQRRGQELTRTTLAQLRDARVTLGISQAALAEQIGITQASVSLLEAGKLGEVSLVRLAEIASILGLEPSLTLHPVGPPIRDKGHEALIARFRRQIGTGWKVTRETAFPAEGDPRWWDLLLRLPRERYLVGVEAETRIRDLQALVRRMKERARDGGADHVVILLSDTATNRRLIREFRDALGPEFNSSPAAILAALRDPAPLPGSGVILL